MQAFATKEDLKAVAESLRRHFDVVADRFDEKFNTLYDWSIVNTSSLDRRVSHLETSHGGRLLSLKTRVTRIEKRRK